MTTKYKYSDVFTFDPETFRIIIDSKEIKCKEIKLSQNECAVLELLCSNAMRVVERNLMLSEIWRGSESSDISLNKSILLLRRKFESIGIKNSIDTVPRVGYILKLDVETFNETILSQSEDVISNGLEINKETLNRKNPLPDFIINAIAIFSAIAVAVVALKNTTSLIDENIGNDIQLIELDYDQHLGGAFFTEDIDEAKTTSYLSFINQIKSNKKLFSLMSNESLSILKLSQSGEAVSQSVFLIDHEHELNPQLTCILKYIDSESSLNYPIYPTSLPSEMRFTSINFFNSCGFDDFYLGTMNIETTDSYDYISTRIQNISFVNKDKIIFELKMYSRSEYDGINIKLNLKSLDIKSTDQNKIQINPHILNIFEEITQDITFLGTVDSKSRVYTSSIFGGILFHSDKM
ncbi:winged helix-turn-helix domain-containing protein [Vibrio cholerae]|uniref:winged helix-turn-helix domain-containing protein n=1 Tax=Vibrio cholerae TaxID=666 RepID=UPI0029342ADB|nr:winged helix-turn-helix domain-containing protein [Vibrio cholerae]MDV2305939.1 winged helix-turn-helix domain-containing protein [Vibrio cholerae]